MPRGLSPQENFGKYPSAPKTSTTDIVTCGGLGEAPQADCCKLALVDQQVKINHISLLLRLQMMVLVRASPGQERGVILPLIILLRIDLGSLVMGPQHIVPQGN